MNYQWDFSVISIYWIALLQGTVITLLLTLLSCIFGSLFGLVLTLCRLSKLRVLRWASVIYIETFLALPLLVLIVWIYYCLPITMSLTNISALSTALLAMTLNLAPFVGETLRAGFEAVPKGYLDAGYCVGMTDSQVFHRIHFPLALRVVTPPLLTQYITTLKLSSLASVIAVPELLYTTGNIISITYRPLELYTTVALIYIAIILPLSAGVRALEKKYVSVL